MIKLRQHRQKVESLLFLMGLMMNLSKIVNHLILIKNKFHKFNSQNHKNVNINHQMMLYKIKNISKNLLQDINLIVKLMEVLVKKMAKNELKRKIAILRIKSP